MLLGLGDYRDNSTSPKESYNLMVQHRAALSLNDDATFLLLFLTVIVIQAALLLVWI